MNYPRCQLLPGREKSLLRRHPWVFSGALAEPDAAFAPGETVLLCAADGTPLASAAWSPESQLRARVWSFDPEEVIDADFFRARIARATAWRRMLGLLDPAGGCRLIYSESDGLPGLIVDRYGEFAAAQFTGAGAERFRDTIAGLLLELPFLRGVYERSDVPVRGKEGLAERRGMLAGENIPAEVEIVEEGLTFAVDLRHGQKTGFYFDLRSARSVVRRRAAGRRVLNVFAYTGGFAVAALAGGAVSVLNVDSSAPALARAEKNLRRNGFASGWENCCGDAFRILRELDGAGEKFDLVILDPPKLIPGKAALLRGCRGYQDLARLGFRLLDPGGMLANFSCSGLMTAELFQKITADAALEAGRDAAVIARMEQAPDHPTALAVPETFYLKGLLSRVE
ncbi:MAG: class I SAM-dependent methyltransferase [Lentisphaeria bacterium]|nr:class I SAM-dependent methyltransferase [Lentisphaeria bacterium]